jgi:beta-glucosidase
VRERYKKSVDAGVDQYGGENDPEHIVDLVRSGELSEARIDQSLRRILLNKFELGLFEHSLVDEGAISALIRTPQYLAAGLEAQRKSIVLLNNKMADAAALPVAEGTKIFVDGLDANEAKRYGTVVDSADQADVVVLYLPTIFNGNQVPGSDELMDHFLSTILPDNNLAFSPAVLDKAKGYSKSARLITVVDLNRPAILTELNQLSDGLIGTFGVYDSVLFDVIFGQFSPQGKLPFEIPSSMAAVMAQQEDMPDDSEKPVFEFGHGLSY